MDHDPSTISREFERNALPRGDYAASADRINPMASQDTSRLADMYRDKAAVPAHGKKPETIDSLFDLLHIMPEKLRNTMTLDNGEFQNHGKLKALLKLETYFCDPHVPWQRGMGYGLADFIRGSGHKGRANRPDT